MKYLSLILAFSFIQFFNVSLAEDFAHRGYLVKFKKGMRAQFFNQHINLKSGLEDKNELVLDDFAVIDSPAINDKSFSSAYHSKYIEYIEPNYIYTTSVVNFSKLEPKFKKQWGLQNTGKNSGGFFTSGLKGADINAIEAWDITKGNKKVIIAVIDSGVNHKHKDLAANMWQNNLEIYGEEGVDDDGNGYIDDFNGYDFMNDDNIPDDKVGHGTHCAGVIGADHNGVGVAGVMANVSIMALKFLGSRGGELKDAIAAIEYAIDKKVNVMSNSWGGGGPSQALEDAISKANDNGIIFVAAAGNAGNNNDNNPTYPASYKLPNVISVGSMNGGGNSSSFSNFGLQSVHVYAPGSGIYSTYKNSYRSLSGTSMAAPFVSGIIGLMYSHDPYIEALDIRSRLVETSVKRKTLRSSLAGGWVDAYRAIKNIQN